MVKTKQELVLRLGIVADGRYKFDRGRVRRAVRKILLEKGVNGRVVLSLAVVGDRKMKELSKIHLGEEKTTDVLSFSQTDPPSPKATEGQEGRNFIVPDDDVLMLGDVVVSYPQAKKQAMEFFKLLDEEMDFLVCHGVLHLLGVHHD
jgi:probable rRNA maturation factor